jgi:hypothetical protein
MQTVTHHVFQCLFYICYNYGRAEAQTVSSRFPTAAGRVRTRVKSCRIGSGQSDIGADFLPVLRFLLSIPCLHQNHHLLLFRAGTIGQIVVTVIVDWVPVQPSK